jgi:hypothetical protein
VAVHRVRGHTDSSDFGQNVNARWSNSDLIDHLLLGEGLRRDPIMLEGSTELRKRSNHPEGYQAEGPDFLFLLRNISPDPPEAKVLPVRQGCALKSLNSRPFCGAVACGLWFGLLRDRDLIESERSERKSRPLKSLEHVRSGERNPKTDTGSDPHAVLEEGS